MSHEILTLKRNTVDLSSVLINGGVVRHGEPLVALPREVIPIEGGVDSIVFELIRTRDIEKPSRFRIFLRAIRPESLTMILGPCLATLFYGMAKKWDFEWSVALCSLLGAVFFQISVNVLNDVEDHLRLIDLPGTLGGSGVIQQGWINARQLRRFGYGALGLGALMGIPAILSQPPVLVLIGALGAFGVVAYSGRPLGMKYRAWGDLVIFLLLGPLLTLGFSLAVMGKVDFSAEALGCFFGLISWAILHSNNVQDIEFDRANGITTLASWVGFRASRFLFVGLYGLAFLTLLVGWRFGQLPAFLCISILFSFPLIFKISLRIFKASGPASALLSGIRRSTTQLHWILSALVCAGFLLSYFV